MSDAVLVALISSLSTVALGILGLWKVTTAQKEIHLLVNSRMDELLSLTKASSHAEGVKDEKAGKPSGKAPKARKR